MRQTLPDGQHLAAVKADQEQMLKDPDKWRLDFCQKALSDAPGDREQARVDAVNFAKNFEIVADVSRDLFRDSTPVYSKRQWTIHSNSRSTPPRFIF